MAKIVEKIQAGVAAVTKAHNKGCELDKLDDRAAVQVGIALTLYALESLEAHAARREAHTMEGAEANRSLLADIQKKATSRLMECGVSGDNAGTLVLSLAMYLGSIQPDMKTLRNELLGDGPKVGRFI